MTNERMALAELLEKGSDNDLLREMIGYVAQRLRRPTCRAWWGLLTESAGRAGRTGATASVSATGTPEAARSP